MPGAVFRSALLAQPPVLIRVPNKTLPREQKWANAPAARAALPPSYALGENNNLNAKAAPCGEIWTLGLAATFWLALCEILWLSWLELGSGSGRTSSEGPGSPFARPRA